MKHRYNASASVRSLKAFLSMLTAVVLLVGNFGITAQQSVDLDSLRKHVSRVGKLSFKERVDVRFVKKNELSTVFDSRFMKNYSDDMARKEAVFLRIMGFVDHTIDVRLKRKKILLNTISGMYDPMQKEVIALERHRSMDYVNSTVLTHELRRGLQHYYYDVPELLLETPYSDFDDRKLAVLAALEGDATFLMVKCSGLDAATLSVSQTADALLSFSPVPNPSMMYREPAAIKQLILMPFLNGVRFVNAIYQKGKWKAVNRILRRPPLSTEQIMHPEKYLKREKPVEVLIDYEPESHRLYHTGVIGEFMLNVLVKPKGVGIFSDHANGWGGDTYHIFKHPTQSSYFMVWKSMWDKSSYCAHYFSQLKRFVQNHFKVTFKPGRINKNDFLAGKNNTDYFFITRKKNKLFYVRTNNRKQMNILIYGGIYD